MRFESRTEVIMNEDELCAIDEALSVLKELQKQMGWGMGDVLLFETQSSQTEHSKFEVDTTITLLEDIVYYNQIFVE